METSAEIKVLGIGGAGSAAVNRMIEKGLRGVDFIAIDTDAQALMLCAAPIRMCIGNELAGGLGTGGDPSIGSRAAEESSDAVYEVVNGAAMVFITSGMGGGTGTGGAPVIAHIARETGALTVGMVTLPFKFEGATRREVALEGIEKLKEHVDTLVAISNDRLWAMVGKPANILAALPTAFRTADDVLRLGVAGTCELITLPGLINLDLADVRSVMAGGEVAMMAIGQGQGKTKAVDAAEQAIASPSLNVTIDGARAILFNVTGGLDLSLFDVEKAAEMIREAAHPDANVIFGAVTDETMEDKIRISVIAIGLDPSTRQGSSRRPGGWPGGRPNGSPSPSLRPGSPPSPVSAALVANRSSE